MDRTRAAVRNLAVADRRGDSPPRTTGSPEYVGIGRRRGVVDRAAPRRGRPPRADPPPRRRRRGVGRCPRRGTCAAGSSSTAARPWAGAARRRRPAASSSSHFADQRLYAYEPDAPDRAAPADPALGGRRRTALGRPADPPGPRRGLVRAGGVHRRRARPTCAGCIAAVPLDGSAAARPRAPCANWPTTATGSSPARGSRRTAGGPPGSPGTIRGCPGTAPSCWSPRSTDGRRPRRGPRPARRPGGVGRPGRLGRRRHPARRHATAPAGGTCTGSTRRPARPVSLCPREEEFGGPLWKLGQRWFAPLDDGLIAVLHGVGAPPRSASSTRRPASWPTPPGRWTEWAPTSPSPAAGSSASPPSPRSAYEVVELDTAHRPHPGRSAARTRPGGPRRTTREPRPAPSPAPTAARSTPTSTRRTTPTAPRPTANCRPTWCGCTAAPPAAPRWSSTWRSPTSPRAASASPRSTTAAPPATAAPTANRLREQWGVVDVEDCAAVAAGARRRGRRRPGAAGDPRRQRGRLDDRRLPRRHRPLRLRHDHLPGPRPRRLGATGETHDFESQYLESLIGPLAEVPEPLPRALAASNHADRIAAPVPAAPGAGRRDLPARAVRALPGADGRAAASRTPTSPSRARATASAGPTPWSARWRPNSPSTARLRLRPPRRPAAGADEVTLRAAVSRPARRARPARAAGRRRPGRRRRAQRSRPRERLDAGPGHPAGLGPRTGRRAARPGRAPAASAISPAPTQDRPRDLRRPGATRRWRRCCAPAAATARSAWSTCSTGTRCAAAGPKASSATATSPRCTRRSPPGSGLATLHGPDGRRAPPSSRTPAPRSTCARTLFEPGRPVRPRPGAPAPWSPAGPAGVTLGGCLSLLAADSAPRRPGRRPPAGSCCWRTSARRPYRLDRILTQLLRSGWLDGVAGHRARLVGGVRSLRGGTAGAARPARRPGRTGRGGAGLRALRLRADRAARPARGPGRGRAHPDDRGARTPYGPLTARPGHAARDRPGP